MTTAMRCYDSASTLSQSERAGVRGHRGGGGGGGNALDINISKLQANVNHRSMLDIHLSYQTQLTCERQICAEIAATAEAHCMPADRTWRGHWSVTGQSRCASSRISSV